MTASNQQAIGERVAAAVGGNSARPYTWPEAPALPEVPEPDRLHIAALPPVLRAYITSLADSLQVPQELPAMGALACCSAATAGRIEIEPRPGWREPVGLYVGVILPAGSRKSPCFAALKRPLQAWEREHVAQIAAGRNEALDRVRIATKRLEREIEDSAKGKSDDSAVQQARLELMDAEARVPADGRLLVGDATPEALVKRLAEQEGRAAVLEPEPGPLQAVAGRYDSGPRLNELTKAWSAEPFLVDRTGRDHVRVEHPALTLAVMLQPGVIEALPHSHAFRAEGLLARFLWCLPEHGLGQRRTGPDVPLADDAAAERYAAALRCLLDLQPATEWDGRPAAHVLGLHRDALDVLYAFEAEIEGQLGDGARLAPIRDWGGKAVGQALRVAAQLALLRRASDADELVAPMDAESMQGGVALVRGLSSHALALLGPTADEREAELRYLLNRLQQMPTRSTERSFFERCKGKTAFSSMDDLRAGLDELSERGCVRRVAPERAGPGRTPSPVIELHPQLRGEREGLEL